jgi:adenine C2-methylase RlmN of 23S rRNA A2503 and tRNA A37
MSKSIEQMSGKDMKTHLIDKCLQDENFKQQFLKDPKGCIKKEFNVELPEQLEVKAVADTATTKWFVVPYEQDMSDENLKAISGGGMHEVFTGIAKTINGLFGKG